MENIDFFSKIFISQKSNKITDLINAFNVETYLDKRINQLSDGIKKKISLIVAFLANPKVLIFDEPYSYLDSDSVESLNQIIDEYNKNGATFLISDNSSFVSVLNPTGFFEL